jgi:hypothetical protein
MVTGQVSDQGDVLYVLPRNFKTIIRGHSLLLRLEPALAGARRAGEYVVRVSFGTALVASVVVVSLAIIALLTAASSSDRDDRRCGIPPPLPHAVIQISVGIVALLMAASNSVIATTAYLCMHKTTC